jgi:predicted DNA-binding protein (MmcQ/YjbR family)
MKLDSVREFCLSLPRVTENVQWEDELCFKVQGKIFAMIGLGSVPQRLVFKCDPESFAELTEREGIVPAPYVGRYKWVMLESLDILPKLELEGFVSRSYSLVANKVRRAKARRAAQRVRKLA